MSVTAKKFTSFFINTFFGLAPHWGNGSDCHAVRAGDDRCLSTYLVRGHHGDLGL